MVIWKREWATFEEDRSPRVVDLVVDGRKTNDKSGAAAKRDWHTFPDGTGIREDKKRVRGEGMVAIFSSERRASQVFISYWP